VFNTVSHFSTLDCWCEENTSIPLDQVIKKNCETVFNSSGSKQADPKIHNQYLQSQALVSPCRHFSIHCIPLRSPRTSSKPPPMLLIWRWICFYPARPEIAEEKQPITNLKPRTFTNITVTNKRVKVFTRRLLFCSNLYDVSGMI